MPEKILSLVSDFKISIHYKSINHLLHSKQSFYTYYTPLKYISIINTYITVLPTVWTKISASVHKCQ